MKKIRIFLYCILSLSACAPLKKHQQSWPNTSVMLPNGQMETIRDVAAVEFDDHGDLWDPDQLHQAIKLVKSTPKPLVVTFVHGWRHDARPDDQDFQQFANLIQTINKVKPGGYTACGIFIGWRGGSINERNNPLATLPAVFSFWDRKHATDRVADIGVSRTLNQVSAEAWSQGGRSVAIGHSFGGRILEKVSGSCVASQSSNTKALKPLADLVVLINPASESLTARKLKLALQNWKEPYPLFVTIGANSDFPNQKAWPLGYYLVPQPQTRDYHPLNKAESQRTFLDVTVANDPRQITHGLESVATSEKPPASEKTLVRNFSAITASKQSPIWIRLENESSVPKPYRISKVNPNAVKGAEYVIESQAYWTMRVPPEILDGHSGDRNKGGVLSTPITDLISALLVKTAIPSRSPGPPQVRPSTAPLQNVVPTSVSQ